MRITIQIRKMANGYDRFFINNKPVAFSDCRPEAHPDFTRNSAKFYVVQFNSYIHNAMRALGYEDAGNKLASDGSVGNIERAESQGKITYNFTHRETGAKMSGHLLAENLDLANRSYTMRADF